MMTRTEHLKWAKQRALEYVNRGELQNAIDSMVADLDKHPQLQAHPAILITYSLLAGGHLTTPEAMRAHIQGFN